jgi:SAM-dependent methyltransferase
VLEHDKHLVRAATGTSLIDTERHLLREVLQRGPEVVHPQSGNGLDDIALVQAGAKSVVGVDYRAVTVGAAQRRATELGVACRYLIAAVPGMPLANGCADLVYTGKGALMWINDLEPWAREIVRVLRPSGHLFTGGLFDGLGERRKAASVSGFVANRAVRSVAAGVPPGVRTRTRGRGRKSGNLFGWPQYFHPGPRSSNNAGWCAVVCRTHGIPNTFGEKLRGGRSRLSHLRAAVTGRSHAMSEPTPPNRGG